MSAPLQQPLRRVDLAGTRDGHQWRLAFRIPRVGIGARFEQRLNDRRRADDRRFGQRGRAELVLEFDVGACLDERAHELEIVVRRGVHDRGRSIRPGRVDIGTLRQELQRGRAIATLRGIEERALGCCCD